MLEMTVTLLCFHSINVPSEWGHNGRGIDAERFNTVVSIQLMSPASGDEIIENRLKSGLYQFPFN